MNVKEIVIAHLKSIGADGLCADECGCGLDDLMPCMCEGIEDCVPARRRECKYCPDKSDCDIYVSDNMEPQGGCFKPVEEK